MSFTIVGLVIALLGSLIWLTLGGSGPAAYCTNTQEGIGLLVMGFGFGFSTAGLFIRRRFL